MQAYGYIRALEKVASRYAPSRLLSFEAVHVFVALQLISKNKRVSRDTLSKELSLGEGAIKTLVKHMKMKGLVETSNRGTEMTARGEAIFEGISSFIPAEMSLPESHVALGSYNYAVLVREFGFVVRSGIEQRDSAIKRGATGATTLLYREGRFVMPDSGQDPLKREIVLKRQLAQTLKPQEGDVVIIGSADNRKIAELAAKGAALATIMAAHEK
jgi:DNA-binding transcriptional regulator LsrR (DeoR family)